MKTILVLVIIHFAVVLVSECVEISCLLRQLLLLPKERSVRAFLFNLFFYLLPSFLFTADSREEFRLHRLNSLGSTSWFGS